MGLLYLTSIHAPVENQTLGGCRRCGIGMYDDPGFRICSTISKKVSCIHIWPPVACNFYGIKHRFQVSTPSPASASTLRPVRSSCLLFESSPTLLYHQPGLGPNTPRTSFSHHANAAALRTSALSPGSDITYLFKLYVAHLISPARWRKTLTSIGSRLR